MGKMKLRQFAPASETMTKAQEMQLMIRHPNNSGLQRDPLTQYFIPAHFVQKLKISQDDRLILSMEGGISISEDPISVSISRPEPGRSGRGGRHRRQGVPGPVAGGATGF